uniref:Uncharacterized protein n=1 Tax=Pyricularia oryzae (strain P131) TaxID=1143193 RepID=L7JM98_PYRO1
MLPSSLQRQLRLRQLPHRFMQSNVRRIQEINPDIIRNAINGATNKGPYYQVLVLPDLLALKYKPISGTRVI